MGNWMETWVGGKVGECWRDMEKGTRSAWLLLMPEAGHRRAHLNIMEFCYIQVPFLKQFGITRNFNPTFVVIYQVGDFGRGT